ncbi:MAG: thioredoxin family protein [Bacteroidales bacterium]|nr:thioredoxin family protein [Bacteroidales bacterium]
MKKLILPLILLLLTLSVLLTAFHFSQKSREREQVFFDFNPSDFEPIDTNTTIGEKLFTVLIFYSYDCELCHYEAEIIKKCKVLDNVEFIWVSSNISELAKDFYRSTGLDTMIFHMIARMEPDLIFDKYKIPGTPSIIIYKNGKLLKKRNGMMDISELNKIFNVNELVR